MKITKLTDIVLVAALCAVAFCCIAACSEKGGAEKAEPEVFFACNTVNADRRGGVLTVSCEAVNISYQELRPVCAETWLKDFTLRSDGMLVFSVEPNAGDTERYGMVSVMYGDLNLGSFTVVQEAFSDGFLITVENISRQSVSYSVYPADDDMSYITLLMFKSDMDSYYYTDGKLHESDLEYIDRSGLPMSDFIKKGDASGIVYDNLLPSVDFVIYAYEVDNDGNMLGGVEKYTFTTDANTDMTDMTFDIDISDIPENGRITMEVVPSYDDRYYYFDIVPVKSLEDRHMPLMEHCAREVAEQIMLGEILGMPLETVIDALCSKGPDSLDISVSEEGEHIAYAYSVGEDGFINSEITTVEISY